MNKLFSTKWRLAIKVLPYIFAIVVFKLIAHNQGFEFISLSSLFTALISANIFLIGFLISGVLVDYKEGEKIPGEMASSLEAITDEVEILYEGKKAEQAASCLNHIKKLNVCLINWFYKKTKTIEVMAELKGFNQYFLQFESLTQANFIVRMKQEQNNLRRLLNRAHSIRETSFNRSGYTIAEIITFVLTLGLIFTRLEPFYENIFFVIFVPFILIYMILLIKDLDNPFEYYVRNKETADEVSLKPLIDLKSRLEK